MKFRILAPLFASLILTTASFSCSHPTKQGRRSPSSNTDYLRVAHYDLSADNYLVLIGIDRTLNTDPNMKAVDASASGFKSTQDITHLDPKYLISVNRRGIQSVYSFDLGNRRKADSIGHTKPEFPELLLDINKWRAEIAASQYGGNIAVDLLNEIIGGLWVESIDYAWKTLASRWESPKKAAASYLEQMIAESLDEGAFPELLNAVPLDNWKSEITDLGAALSVRYHAGSIYTALPQSSDQAKRDALYATLRGNMQDNASQQFNSLNERANAECLVTERLTASLAMLEFNKDEFKKCVAYSPRRLDLKGNPEQVLSKLDEIPTDSRGRVPLALYILNDQNDFIQLINFADPNRLRKRDLLQTIHEDGIAAAELFGSVATGVSEGIEWTDNTIMYFVSKGGSTLTYQRIEGYSDLMMLLDTGLASVHLQDFIESAVVKSLQFGKMPADQLARIQAGLKSADATVVERTVNDALEYLKFVESGIKGSAQGAKVQAASDDSRADHWNRFVAWMNDPGNVKKFDDKLNELTTPKTGNWLTRLFGAKTSAPANNPAPAAPGPAPVTASVAAAPVEPATQPVPVNTDPVATRPDPNTPRPIILFMVDGLRPDRVITAANRGELPNIKARFLDHGVQMNSFTNYSVSLPSWSTVLSGYEADRHGLHSSSTASRDPKVKWENLLDFRPDTHFYVIGKESRLYKRMVETHTKLLQEYSNPDEVLIGTAPASDTDHIAVADGIKTLVKDYQRTLLNDISVDSLLDIASGKYIQNQIIKFPGKAKMVMMWFGGVDHSAHANNHTMLDSYLAIDTAIGQVLDAAKKDPVLKDATVILVSDHGEMGGEETPDPDRKPIPDAYFLNNTCFNVMQFFTGDLPDSRDYNFVASSSKADEPIVSTGSIAWVLNNIYEPYFFTYDGTQHNKGLNGYHKNTSVLTEPFGDAMAHILLLEGSKEDPTRRFNYYQLTHYPAPTKKGVVLNMPEDLLNHQITNVDFTDDIKEKIRAYNGFHPVQLVAIPLPGAVARESAEKLTANDSSKPSTRDPIVVRARGGKTALILVRDGDEGTDNETYMRYIPIKNFDQAADGTVSGQASMDPNDDPFGYIGEGVQWDPLLWRTDREWLALLQNTTYPTGITSIPRQATLHKAIQNMPNIEAELPDMNLVSAYGFDFNPFQMHQGDHGGITRDQVRTTLFISDDHMPKKLIHVETPIFNRDLTPTILDYQGLTPAANMPGRSMKSVIENAVEMNR